MCFVTEYVYNNKYISTLQSVYILDSAKEKNRFFVFFQFVLMLRLLVCSFAKHHQHTLHHLSPKIPHSLFFAAAARSRHLHFSCFVDLCVYMLAAIVVVVFFLTSRFAFFGFFSFGDGLTYVDCCAKHTRIVS